MTARSTAVRTARDAIPRSDRIHALLHHRVDGQDVLALHPYKKWTGAHWRLVSVVELGVPVGHPRALDLLQPVLGWLGSAIHHRGIKTIAGRTRRCASQEGNALAVAVRLGLALRPRR